MPFTVTMPKLSPTMEEGTIAKWHKKEGDAIKAGDLLLEVATDKATVEYNALDDGFLRKILVQEKGSAIVNQPIAICTEKAEESIEGYQPEGETPVRPTVSPEVAPKGEEPKKEDVKPVSAPMSQPAFVPEPPLENYEFSFPSEERSERAIATPAARKVARDKGLDLKSVKGTGPNGRVSLRDLDLAQPDLAVSFAPREIPQEIPGSFEERELSPMRKVIAQRLQQAKSFIPHIYIRQEINAKPLVETREMLKKGNLSVTFNDFVIRACALALREHPEVNSGFDSVKQSMILFKTVDISVAVTVEGGLITPIVRHADYKNLGEISKEVKELARKAKASKLKPEEYKGGSFTISNMGMFKVSEFAAIINPPQAAILAVGGIEEAPCIENQEIRIGKKMILTLSVDHRVLDGAEAALFIKTVQKYLENPALLLV